VVNNWAPVQGWTLCFMNKRYNAGLCIEPHHSAAGTHQGMWQLVRRASIRSSRLVNLQERDARKGLCCTTTKPQHAQMCVDLLCCLAVYGIGHVVCPAGGATGCLIKHSQPLGAPQGSPCKQQWLQLWGEPGDCDMDSPRVGALVDVIREDPVQSATQDGAQVVTGAPRPVVQGSMHGGRSGSAAQAEPAADGLSRWEGYWITGVSCQWVYVAN
jgi:hypothetical protein